MAKLPIVRRLLREDYQGAPQWIDKLIYTVNNFFEGTYQALAGNITFGENIRSQTKVFQIVAGATAADNVFTFSFTASWKPQGVLLVSTRVVSGSYVPITSAVGISWRVGEDSTIVIDAISGLTAGTKYELTVIVI